MHEPRKRSVHQREDKDAQCRMGFKEESHVAADGSKELSVRGASLERGSRSSTGLDELRVVSVSQEIGEVRDSARRIRAAPFAERRRAFSVRASKVARIGVEGRDLDDGEIRADVSQEMTASKMPAGEEAGSRGSSNTCPKG